MDQEPPGQDLVEIGFFPRAKEGREQMLVILALRLPCWLLERRGGFALCVLERDAGRARDELSVYTEERRPGIRTRGLRPIGTAGWAALLGYAFWLAGFQLVAVGLPESAFDRMAGDSGAILSGEWWRAVTSLFLHGDSGHLLGNILTGALFGYFIAERFGPGPGWLAVLVSAVAANFLNAILHGPDGHRWIGASTAVFAALGLLVGAGAIEAWRGETASKRGALVVPIGAGLAFLAWLGASEEGNTDYVAHFTGLLAGMLLGAPLSLLPERIRTGRRWGLACALAMGGIVGGALLAAGVR